MTGSEHDERQVKAAQNQSLFRVINEEIERFDQQFGVPNTSSSTSFASALIPADPHASPARSRSTRRCGAIPCAS